MTTTDPNIEAVELVARALGPLLNDFVLVGGYTVGLLISDRTRPVVRHTLDVDLFAEVTSKTAYYELSEKLRRRGFRESGAEVICRWVIDGISVDIMSSEESVMGFTNRWYRQALDTAVHATLPSGLVVRHAAGPAFIATKIEAFLSRGQGDFAHHDVEDIVNVIDGRPELLDEIAASTEAVRTFIRDEVDDLLSEKDFADHVAWHLGPSAAEQARAPLVIERLRRLAGL